MKKLFRWILRLGLAGFVAGMLAIGVAYLLVAPDLPDVETLRDVRLQVPLRVYSSDGRLIQVYGEKRRIPVSIEQVPSDLVNAFIAGEDARYYEHPGVDYQGISRAVFTLLTTGEKTVGGSTITQMLARNVFLTLDKTFSRKTKEIFLALRMERELSKDEILELFLNKILLGHRAYGVGAAAEVYYGKKLDELTLAQCAMIASLAKAPSRINPISSPDRALQRRNYVLGRMLELGYIDLPAYQGAVEEKDYAAYHGADIELSAPYLAEMVRSEAIGLLGQEAFTGGYEIFTTIDSRLQSAANQAVVSGLEEYDHRHGYRGAEAHVQLPEEAATPDWEAALGPFSPLAGLAPALVTDLDEELALLYTKNGQTVALHLEDVAWARPFIERDRVGAAPKSLGDVLSRGDVIRISMNDDGSWRLGQIPEVEAALVSLDPDDGAILALVGGYDYSRNKYNRVTQSRRQPGSSFKPFLYSAALANGYTTASLINDAPIVFEDPELERTWKPQNFSEQFFGPTRLREAMVNSRNLVSIRLLRDLGINTAREYISAFGFALADLPADLTMALGSANLPPLSMARGYAVFANGGFLVDPHFIREIRDIDGRPIFRATPALACEDCAQDSPSSLATAEPETQKDRPAYRPLALGQEDSAQSEDPPQAVPATEAAQPMHAPRAISPQNAYLVRSMMMDVIKRGTGKRANQLGRVDLAGKTGTSNDQHDAWFSGYNDHIVTTVWVGFNSYESLGKYEVGGRAALPIWIEFMRTALEGMENEPPAIPEGLAAARIDPETGLLAASGDADTVLEWFEADKLPAVRQSTDGAREDAPTEEDPYDIF